MPPKKANPMEHPPPDSSSGDADATTSGDENESSSDDEEQTQAPTPLPETQQSQPAAITETPIQNNASDSESGDESSDDDEEEQTQTPTPLPKTQTLSQQSPGTRPQSPPSVPKSPIQNNGAGSKSVSGYEDESQKLKQPSKPAASSPKKDTPSKNGGPSIEAYRTPIAFKSVSVNGGVGGSDKKRFQRLWTEDDEVAVLEGMIEYKKKGSDPVEDLIAFRDSIQGRLHFECTMGQLREKVNRMKRNFQKQYNKNQNKIFPDPQNQKVFDLSKMIWGGTTLNGAATPNGKAVKGTARAVKSSTARGKKVEEGVVMEDSKGGQKMDIDVEKPSGSRKRLRYGSYYDGSEMEDFVMEKGLSFLSGEKRAQLAKKWKKLQMAELKLYAKKQKLRKEQSDLIMAAMRE